MPASTALYTEVLVGRENGMRYEVGVHKAVGGMGDFPVPGDMLCAAIAACLDSTIRIIANRLSIPLKSLEVSVKATVDVRGTLQVDKSVPVAFQSLEVDVDLQPMMKVPDTTLHTILKVAEQSCVVLQTLRNPPSIAVRAVSQSQIRNAA